MTVPHDYDDKYLLAEIATHASLAGIMNALEVLGVLDRKLTKWSETNTVTLAFRTTEKYSLFCFLLKG